MMRSSASLSRLAVALAAVAVGTLTTTAFVAERVPYERTPIVYGAGLCVLLALPLVVALKTGTFGVLDPIWPVLLFLGVQFPLQAIYLAGVSDYANHLMPNRSQWVHLVNVSLLLAGVAAAVFSVAYAASTGPARWLSARIPSGRGAAMGQPLAKVIFTFSALGVVGFVAFFVSVGGIGDFVHNLSRHNASSAGKFYLLWVARLFPIANLLWFTQRVVLRPESGRIGYLVHLLVSILMLLSFGGRAQVLYLLELLIVVRFFCVRDIKLRHLVAFAVGAAIFLGIYGAYRESTEKHYSQQEFQQLSPRSRRIVREREANRFTRLATPRGLADQLFQYDRSSLDMFVLLLRDVPERFSYQYGATLLDVFIRPIPGALWDAKPKPLNTQYNQKLLGARRSGKKASILGEGYVNANVPGIMLLMALLAVFARAIVLFRDSNIALGPAMLVYAILYKGVWSMTGGGFGEIAMGALIYLIPVAVAFVYAKAPDQRSLRSMPARRRRAEVPS